ncbi:MAG: ATP-dependent zinc metalloprotease FtsH [Armatimonadota bacterium]|nr:ATP-dependent zinc metalloprotease FtsH [Armatimonadota bacterium]MCX7776473.1 ATP-dependent zinc metalloprotease FtsH [Armatimonadota bacterium]MDW8024270.1 ATP-dependent zinc metalloprotease FtsH [Armatimonadota bacterium]
MARMLRLLLMLTLIAFGLSFLAQIGRLPGFQTVELSYTEFRSAISSGEIAEVTISGDQAFGVFKSKRGKFRVQLPPENVLPTLLNLLEKHDVKVHFRRRPSWGNAGNVLMFIVMVLFMFGIIWFLLRQMTQTSNQALSFGRSRAKRYMRGQQRVTFEDVAGCDEAKEELREVIEFLKNPQRFQALGANMPKGILLLGPPGCGKTLLARAVAGEADVPFIHASGSEFVEMFVGVGAARVRDLFEQAKALKPCIIFIDELDAVGRLRFAGLGGGHDEREQTLNQLLVEMDGFDPNTGIVLMAATNRPDVLDPALLRPGRFDRRVVVDYPDADARKQILKVHARGKPLENDVDFEVLAKLTPGFSGADLANMVNEAAILAARKGKDKISMADFEEALEKVAAGPERKSRRLSDREKRILAYHEAGHALVSKLLPHGQQVRKVTVIPRGLALGYTLQFPWEDKHLWTRNELLDQVTSLLAGRVAEETVFGEATTGAQNDLEHATEMVRKMVCEFGMSTLGPMTLGRRTGPIFLGRDLVEDRNYSEAMANEIDREVKKIISECYERAKRLLEDNRDILEQIVRRLMEKESITGDEIDQIIMEMRPGWQPQQVAAQAQSSQSSPAN